MALQNLRLIKRIKHWLFKKKEEPVKTSLDNDPYVKEDFSFIEVKKEKTTKHMTEGVDYKVL